MTEQPAPYDITPEPQPEGREKFCPFGLAASAGPLGKLSMHRPPCDPNNCALGYHPTQDPPCCSLLALAETLAEVSFNIEHQ